MMNIDMFVVEGKEICMLDVVERDGPASLQFGGFADACGVGRVLVVRNCSKVFKLDTLFTTSS